MNDTPDEMRRRLGVLRPVHIDIRDDSALHAGDEGAKGGGGHYHLKIVAEAFEGHRALARHRMIHEALGELMRQKIHALSIEAFSPAEIQT